MNYKLRYYSSLKCILEKNRYIIVLLVTFFFPVESSQTEWKCIWSDEFQSTVVDTSKWSFDTGTGAPELVGWGNNELEYYTSRSENARCENGMLIIEARKENFRNSTFTSAKMKTKLKGDWTYGRFEIRAKLPKGKGVWPAIWMLPTDNYYGTWAASGEIDIMEMLGQNPSKIYGTIHYGGAWPNNKSSGDSLTLQNQSFTDNFHIFALEWDSSGLRWYMDSTCYQTQSMSKPFDKRFYMVLNIAVGGNWPGAPDNTTEFPVSMIVDYVRVYQKTSASGVVHSCSVHTDKKSGVDIYYDIMGRRVVSFPDNVIKVGIIQGVNRFLILK